MTLAAQLQERRRQWAAFRLWEAQQPPVNRAPADILADLGELPIPPAPTTIEIGRFEISS